MEVTTCIRGQADLLDQVVECNPKGSVLDIGTGSGLAARRFLDSGWQVTATGFDMASYLSDENVLPKEISVFNDVDICDMHCFEDSSFDAVWVAHVLEHVSDTGRALAEIRRILKPSGRLFISVPPFKHQIVGGHLNTGWNIGSLMYVLSDAGFGLAKGRFIRHGYNIFGMVERGDGPLEAGILRRANGDIEKLKDAGRFPEGFEAFQGFDGNQKSVNWKWVAEPKEIPLKSDFDAGLDEDIKMNIGLVVPWITQSKGGTENVGHMMANALAKAGHKVTIFTFDNLKMPSKWALEPGIELVHLSEEDNEVQDHLATVQIASRNPDVLVGLHMNRTMLRYVKWAQKINTPIVLSEHIDPRFPNWLDTFTTEERTVAFSGATLIHLLVDAFKDTVPEFLRSRTRVVPNTIFEPKELAEPGRETTEKHVLAVARLVPRKNFALLLEAFALLSPEFTDWKLQIVGDGGQKADLQKLAKSLGIQKSVLWEGHQDDTYPYYRNAEFFVLPSAFEGFPMTVCEAMAHGLPCVGFDVCNGVNEQILHEKTGFLANEGVNAKSLARQMRKLMEDSSLRAQMGAFARDVYVSKFSNEVVSAAWENLFKEAISIGYKAKAPTQQEIAEVRLYEAIWGRAELTGNLKLKA